MLIRVHFAPSSMFASLVLVTSFLESFVAPVDALLSWMFNRDAFAFVFAAKLVIGWTQARGLHEFVTVSLVNRQSANMAAVLVKAWIWKA